ncbi:anti-sigma B factor antagonist [Actinomycetospora succinea]|uniref:Anti-sigma factor antagonist n=1 Tax=Actinomycetospora succinea TaxID=663603 RepID=A0A4R6UJX3_9PSEU|nr:STAS domain-containing protein [Actinomycetospora succinea]TDQ46426.1 anti-sigma B factor antagonist [Actinomycetospora succinea]
MADDQPTPDTAVSAGLLSPEIAVVRPVGDVDTATATPLRSAIQQQVQAGARHVVLDLSGVEFMGSAGLALLIAERESAIAREGELRLAGVPRTAGRALSLTGLTELFDTYPDADAAVADLR